jgi:hypothetical protein
MIVNFDVLQPVSGRFVQCNVLLAAAIWLDDKNASGFATVRLAARLVVNAANLNQMLWLPNDLQLNGRPKHHCWKTAQHCLIHEWMLAYKRATMVVFFAILCTYYSGNSGSWLVDLYLCTNQF